LLGSKELFFKTKQKKMPCATAKQQNVFSQQVFWQLRSFGLIGQESKSASFPKTALVPGCRLKFTSSGPFTQAWPAMRLENCLVRFL